MTNLEPLLAAAVAAAEVSSTLIHPHHDWTLLVGPLGPDGLDLAAGSDLGRQVRGGAAIAHDLLVGDGQCGIVVGPLTLNGLRGSGRRKASVTKGW